MKRFSAQYVITNTGPILKRAVITTDDDGTILSIADTHGKLEELHSTEFYNGVIIPGFVNCHCHLELSHMKNLIAPDGGLGDFIQQVRSFRQSNSSNIIKAAKAADLQMYNEGIVVCADICNNPLTFSLKKDSKIKYINLLEVFGIDPEKADRRIGEIIELAGIAENMGLHYSYVPHSVYSVSLPLFGLLKEKSKGNTVTSLHFMETSAEKDLLEKQSGALMESYRNSGLLPSRLELASSHASAVLHEITRNGNLILVHNLYSDRATIKITKERGNLYWCLCPGSNLFIEDKVPPVDLLISEGCEIVVGTDSLASNKTLSILQEIKTLQKYFPSLSLEELVKWATLNGSKALNLDAFFGSIIPGTRPGLLLLQNVDLENMKLLPESSVTRLI